MSEVWLHVYDVTNTMSPRANSTIVGINRFFRDGMGIGGIFHGAVQVYEEEWSFGCCERGSGVFGCPPKENPMYTFRESIFLGETALSREEVNAILLGLSREWPGYSYDLLSRNCNHFCEVLCDRLGVPKIPAWVNRFANAGDATVEAVGNTMERLKEARTNVAAAGKIAVRFLFGAVSKPGANGEAQEQQPEEGSSSGSNGSSFRGLLSRVRTFPGTSSSDEENGEQRDGDGSNNGSLKPSSKPSATTKSDASTDDGSIGRLLSRFRRECPTPQSS